MRWPIVAVIALAIVAGAFAYHGKKIQAVATQHEQTAKNEARRADAERSRALAQETAAQEAKAAVGRADLEVARLRAVVAKLRPATPGVTLPSPEPLPAGDLASLDVAKDALIAAQDVAIQDRDKVIEALTIRGDAYRDEADARRRQVVSLELALEAQKAANRGALWRGRLQGVAGGLALGFCAGRR
jgi:hypothetical protein